MKHKKIGSIDELKKRSKSEPLDCFILLAGGLCRSSKSVFYDTKQKKFSIINEIDDTEDDLTAEELYTKSNIGKAINAGTFYRY